MGIDHFHIKGDSLVSLNPQSDNLNAKLIHLLLKHIFMAETASDLRAFGNGSST